MLAYPVNLIDEYDGTVLVTPPDFPEPTTFGAVRAAPLAHAVRASEEAIASRIHARMDVPAPTAPRRVIVPRNADGRESDAPPGDARRARRQVRTGAASTGTFRGRSRARPEPRVAAGPDRRSARGRGPAVGRSWRCRHTFGFTCGGDERWCLSVNGGGGRAAADLDTARETPEGALPRRDRIPAYRRKLTAYSWIASSRVGIVAVARPRKDHQAATQRLGSGSQSPRGAEGTPPGHRHPP